MKTVYCPVIDNQIDGDTCEVICNVADRTIKPSVLSNDILWNEDRQKKCLNCKYHYPIEDNED